jgi:hypothetical protein
MQIKTCQVGGALRLGDNTRLLIHRRQGPCVVLGAWAPAGTALTLDGVDLRPIAGTVGIWTYLFSLQALRRLTLGRFEVRIWLPGELVPHAADCLDWVHVGVAALSPEGPRLLQDRPSLSPSAPAVSALPRLQIIHGGGRFPPPGAAPC